MFLGWRLLLAWGQGISVWVLQEPKLEVGKHLDLVYKQFIMWDLQKLKLEVGKNLDPDSCLPQLTGFLVSLWPCHVEIQLYSRAGKWSQNPPPFIAEPNLLQGWLSFWVLVVGLGLDLKSSPFNISVVLEFSYRKPEARLSLARISHACSLATDLSKQVKQNMMKW